MGKRYEKEYKEYIAKLVVEEGRKRTELSYKMDIPYKTISRWVEEYKASLRDDTEKEAYIMSSEHKKHVAHYQKEIQDLKEQNEILKKAMHIFTKSPE
ncbi:transposase [Peribacillus psychrosaccharolyticus]|uniref:Transposase n=1 Tax=Peribacillus psychrosaccharolyticus TaxID=1407 RepID=A0A974RYQ2_PERPY|nr:transposase [Peribacillus psychrosaccharolyticus]MEC2057997.1 transposase [Peribacillus psychrosaccharolyticus]MED3746659.1 transposase [Peribacillus psychrosaccharolyticus]QQS98645.1 transposase [Peribacillus psychrosaccharolyticus]